MKVHLIPHSHDEVVWVKTFEEYYYGINMYDSGVQHIMDSYIFSLLEDPAKTFV